MNIPLSPCVPENLASRNGFSRPVQSQPAHLHTQAESGAYLRDSSRVPRRRPSMKPPYATGSVPSLSRHAIVYRWRSLPRVRRHRASKLVVLFRRKSTSHRCEGPQIYSMPTDIPRYTFSLVTYSKVKRINRGYVTHYTIKLALRDQDYSSMVIEEERSLLLFKEKSERI